MRELHLTPSPPSSLAQRPTPSSLFYLSHSFPSYRGANTPPPTSVVPIQGASPHPWKIPISTRSSIPSSRCPIRPLKQTNSYCSVEEIKEGKRQRLSCSSSNESNGRKKGNIYIEKGRNYKGGNEEEEEEEEEDEEGDNYYEKAPTSRPSSAMNLVKVKKQNMPKCQKQQQKIPSPAPPVLPPPNLSLLSYVRKNEEIPNRNGWQRRPSTTITTTTTNTPNRKEEINNENEWKENIKFKQRSNRTKFLVHILLFALCCSLLLMALPLLLLWFTNPNILQQQQHSTITTSPQINKQQKHLKKEENKLILENNLTKNLFSFLNFNRDLSIEPTILAKLILEEEGNNPSILRIFEVRSEQTINKDGGQKQGER
uniref:Uncharacterized protein n=1 Tax=Meloidogyne enterolobii TaxID=390850 RepID=A0A6V7XQ60_MELEN|nr:unnamed protein product [Meloidogyne enterolobii]